MDLFEKLYPDTRLHPSFLQLRDQPQNWSTRSLLNEAAARFPDKDGNFVEQYQTQGFDARTFELYVSELLHSEGFKFDTKHPHPDFVCSKDDTTIAVECTTTNPTDRGDGAITPYAPLNPADRELEDILDRFQGDLPIRIAGAIRSKMTKRMGPDSKAYWELPHVAQRPFVIALQSFHEPGALAFSSTAVANYLYGSEHRPDWDSEGNLVIKEREIPAHTRGEKTIPSGFFHQAGSENLSAVLWTNAGTASKFSRIARAGPYPDSNATVLRYGQMYDFDPNAHVPLPFMYIVGDPDTPKEDWGQSAILFHNPNAKSPVPFGLFQSVSEGRIENEQFVAHLKSKFDPVHSMSKLFFNEGHRAAAIHEGNRIWPVLVAAYHQQNKKDNHPVWGSNDEGRD
tara:strand:+ start:637 stop:1830 length:1194 start_codon:yes stop_codon:yes gene_type:complete